MNGAFSIFPRNPDDFILAGLIVLFTSVLLAVMWIAWKETRKK